MDADFKTELYHKMLGTISVAWNEERLLITSITIGEAFENVKKASSKIMELRFPELFEHLQNYGYRQGTKFPIECLDFSWSSPFYRKVYRTLYMNVAVGETVTYAELAAKSGSPRACRAVGTAMRGNRFLIAIPCHRVVGKNCLGNFSAGLDVKKILLELDRVSAEWK